MSDRTKSSVRAGSRSGDAAESKDTAAAEPDASTTQSIPGTGTQRAQAGAPGAGATPPGATPPGSTPAGSTSAGVTSPGATPPAVPPASPAAGTAAPGSDIGFGAFGGGPSTGTGTATVVKDAKAGARGRSRGPGRAGGRGPRRARLQLRHIDTWSALKISLVLSIALFFIWMVAVGILYGVLSALGVFDTLNDLFGQVGSVSGTKSSSPVITAGVVFGGAAVIGAINIVLMTALCTVGTFIYNLCSDLVGGLEITLSERD
ncbi:MAG: DUF3566 domain-containing protein [Blastococcus sp.]